MEFYQNYEDFSNRVTSEKMVLVHLEAAYRLFNFDLESGNIYKRITEHFVKEVKQDGSSLESVDSIVEVVAGKYYFDIMASTLYVHSPTNPFQSKIIVNYRLFFSNAPLTLSWDLQDLSNEVDYDSRVKKSPGFKSKGGNNQQGISITGSGSLVLENTDGYFDEIYDKFVFENKKVEIY